MRNIDVRGWELHLRDPENSGNQIKYLSHGDSFIQACQAEDLVIVEAMVERTQVDLEVMDGWGMTPLHWAAQEGDINEFILIFQRYNKFTH